MTDEWAPRVLNKRDGYYDTLEDIYVGRPTKWGNPFPMRGEATRQTVIDRYRDWIQTQPHLMSQLGELRGHNLVCWCAPLPCHADILLELANA